MQIVTERASFQIAYAGDALEAGIMDVRELAPAMLGLADLVEETATVTLGAKASVRLDVRATGHGSFVVDFQLVLEMAELARDIFASDNYGAVNEVLAVLGLGGVSELSRRGYMWLRKRLAGKTVEKVEEISGSGPSVAMEGVRITTTDGTVFEASKAALTLARSPRAREATAKLLEPLERPGIDSLIMGPDVQAPEGREEAVEIRKEEALRIRGSSESTYVETVADNVTERALTIQTPSFKEDVKWRVTDGASSYLVSMSDAGFVERVYNGEVSLNAKDILRVQLRVHQYRTEDGSLRTEYEVVRVLEHIPPRPALQFRLDL